MSSAEHDHAAFVTRPDNDTVAQLARRVDADVTRRADIRVWEQSGVERLYLDDARTVILKYCIGEFAEADVLVHAAAHDVPVPELLAHMPRDDGSVVMPIEDPATRSERRRSRMRRRLRS